MSWQEKIRPPSRLAFPGITDAGFRYLQQLAGILNNGGLYNKYDSATGDYIFVLADLTMDATWRELDLSSYVPDGTRTIHFKLEIRTSGTIPVYFSLAKPGEYYDALSLEIAANSADEFYYVCGNVDCSRDRKVIYHGTSSADWTACNVSIFGWYY